MKRRFLLLAVAMLATWATNAFNQVDAARQYSLISQPTAARHGLVRPWYTQVQLDRNRARVESVVLHGGILYVQTDRAIVHAIDAEDGRTLWSRRIGRPDHPSLTPGVGKDLLAMLNGSRLYICNRYNGDLLYEVQVDGAPGAGPALSEKRVYVPMVSGLIMAYRVEPLTDPLKELGHSTQKKLSPEEIEQEEADRRENLRLDQQYAAPLVCQSLGKALVQPLVTRETKTEEYCAWPTDRGFLNIARIDRTAEDQLTIKYRLETGASIVAQPTYRPSTSGVPGDSGVIYVASRDGFVHAARERDGNSVWRFSTGEPIVQPAVVVDDRVYVATQLGGMYCLSAIDGSEIWWSAGIVQFVAASAERVYAADKMGRLAILSAKSGARLDTLPLSDVSIRLINDATDRLYLITDTGLVQCLHEVAQTEPLRHNQQQDQLKEGEIPKVQMGNQEPGQPAGEEKPAAEKGSPFGGGGADPFGGGGGGDPFGGGKKAGDQQQQQDDPFGGGGDPFGDAGEKKADPFAASRKNDPFARDGDPFS